MYKENTRLLAQRLVSKNARLQFVANVHILEICSSITHPADPRIQDFGDSFSRSVANTDVLVKEKALDALIAFLKATDALHAGRYADDVCHAVVENCLTGRPKTIEKAEIVLMLWVELEAVNAFLDAMAKVIKDKVAKAVVVAIDIMFKALSDFGSEIVPPMRMLAMLPQIFNHPNRNVRSSSKKLTLELCRWIDRDTVKATLLQEMKGTMTKKFIAELANVTVSAKPNRKIRSEINKKLKQEAASIRRNKAGPSLVHSEEKDETPLILRDQYATFELAGVIKKDLYPHQIDGIKFLWRLHLKKKGGLIADDMGLGKTRQMAAFLAGLFDSSLIKNVLIVCPKTLIPQWSAEILKMGLPRSNRFQGDYKFEELEWFKQKRKGILLTAYGTVNTNIDLLLDISFDYLIIDEGHVIRSSSSDINFNINRISQKSPHRVILTGTPIQNTHEEFYTLFQFCTPSLFGKFESYTEDYTKFLMKGIQGQRDRTENGSISLTKEKFDNLIRPYILRRTKEEVFTNGEIPHKTELAVWLSLSDCQQELYHSLMESDAFPNARSFAAFAALTLFRRICGHPLLVANPDLKHLKDSEKDKKGVTSDGSSRKIQRKQAAQKMSREMAKMIKNYPLDLTSCKISFLGALVGDLVKEKHYILIFSEWQNMLELIEKDLKEKDIKCLRIDGQSSDEFREKTILKFQSGEAPVFLLTSAVGGVGLNLTKADRVIIADPDWNPSTDNQCVDRAYRLGQPNNVVVYRLFTCGTIEEIMYRRQNFKTCVIQSVLELEIPCSFFTPQEIHACFEKSSFEVSPSLKGLLKKQERELLPNSSLQQHVKQVNLLPHVAGTLCYSSHIPKRPTLKKPEQEAKIRNNRSLSEDAAYYANLSKDDPP